jgi:hypothetical protein
MAVYTSDLHRVADAAAGPHALALPVGELGGRLALAEEFVLRQQRRAVGHRIPFVHVRDQCRMLEQRVPRLHRYVPVAERQEGQREHHERRVLARVVEVAEVRRVDRLQLDAVQVLARLGKRLGVANADGELAAAAFGDLVGKNLDALGEGALLAPGGELPFHLLSGCRTRECRQRAAERHRHGCANDFHCFLLQKIAG